MSLHPGIRYIPNNEIDKVKWDQCVAAAENSRIYAHSFYLDFMSDHWDALVLGDYEMIMPLPWKRKFGIQYLYRPFLTAQLGVFGTSVTQEIVSSFIHAIPGRFHLAEIPMNSANIPSPGDPVILRDNYTLTLAHSYDLLYASYNENTRRNLKKADSAGCRVLQGLDMERVIELAEINMKEPRKNTSEAFTRFRKLFFHLQKMNRAVTMGIILDETVIAAAVFFILNGRAYYILAGNHPSSKTTGASHMLIDSFIKHHAGEKVILDFEGSDIPGLAFFYSGFGAIKEQYPFIKINRLPILLKWMKN